MENSWLENLKTNLPSFIESVNKDEFSFNPVSKGLTRDGSKLNLGMSCYGLKIYYMTGLWDELTEDEKLRWGNYLNSFQVSVKSFPDNSFIDENYLNAYKKFSISKRIKNIVKKLINLFKPSEYILDKEKLNNYIRAESKQAISTLYQVNLKNNKLYKLPFNDNEDMVGYLNSLDWTRPWDAGAQFSAMCVFAITQTKSEKQKKFYTESLSEFIYSIADKDSGAFFKGEKPNEKELINGAMKVITGLDWIDAEIPYSEKLIDTCLNIEPYEEGCDLVDLVYVLYMCIKKTNYKEKEIVEYFKKILFKIEQHYFHDEGGFSYFINKSQTLYYGVKISEGKKTPDIHGTILLVWAISMISQIIDLPTSNWKVLKP